MDIASEFSILVEQIEDYEFRVKFDKPHQADLLMDEPNPLGHDSGPNAGRVLGAAIGNCLSASFLFCARRSGVKVQPIRTNVKVQIIRNENRRLRVGRVDVVIDPGLDDVEREKAKNCMAEFEDFCTVTQSVRRGIPVNVLVKGVDEE